MCDRHLCEESDDDGDQVQEIGQDHARARLARWLRYCPGTDLPQSPRQMAIMVSCLASNAGEVLGWFAG